MSAGEEGRGWLVVGRRVATAMQGGVMARRCDSRARTSAGPHARTDIGLGRVDSPVGWRGGLCGSGCVGRSRPRCQTCAGNRYAAQWFTEKCSVCPGRNGFSRDARRRAHAGARLQLYSLLSRVASASRKPLPLHYGCFRPLFKLRLSRSHARFGDEIWLRSAGGRTE